MQPLKILLKWLETHADSERYLFTAQDLRVLFPGLSDPAFKTLLSRAARANYLKRLCRGLYYCDIVSNGLVLFHAAARLRANAFNYISLETVLSDAGVISQIPMNWVSILSSGRSSKIVCGVFGTIEFVHTNQKPAELVDQLSYDTRCRLWRATVPLALRDMRVTRRNCDLIDWEVAREFV